MKLSQETTYLQFNYWSIRQFNIWHFVNVITASKSNGKLQSELHSIIPNVLYCYHVDLFISLSPCVSWWHSGPFHEEVNVMICVCMRLNSTFEEFSNWSIITFVAYSSYAILTWHIYTEWWQSKIIPIIPLDLWINASYVRWPHSPALDALSKPAKQFDIKIDSLNSEYT